MYSYVGEIQNSTFDNQSALQILRKAKLDKYKSDKIKTNKNYNKISIHILWDIRFHGTSDPWFRKRKLYEFE